MMMRRNFFSKVLQCVKLEIFFFNKINFKEFISYYWKMKKKKICGFPVVRMKKK